MFNRIVFLFWLDVHSSRLLSQSQGWEEQSWILTPLCFCPLLFSPISLFSSPPRWHPSTLPPTSNLTSNFWWGLTYLNQGNLGPELKLQNHLWGKSLLHRFGERSKLLSHFKRASQVPLAVNNQSANAGGIRDVSSIPDLGSSPGGGHGNPFQYSYLETPMDRRAWWATVQRVAKIQTRLKRKKGCGTCLEVQWLRLCLRMQGVWVWSLVGELRSHMPCGQKNQNTGKKKKEVIL